MTTSKPYHLISLDPWNHEEVESVLEKARCLKSGELIPSSLFSGKTLCPVFMQPSSRTYLNSLSSFASLGGSILPLDFSKTRCGSKWKEPIIDFCYLLNSCADFVVARTDTAHAIHDFSEHLEIPLINAGNGRGAGAEHPLQGLVDLFTIRQKFGAKHLRALFIGGGHLRVIRTQIKLFLRFGHSVSLQSPPSPVDNSDIQDTYSSQVTEVSNFRDQDLTCYDIIYHNGMDEDPNSFAKEDWVLDLKHLKSREFHGVIMHSLPRLNEVPREFDLTDYNLYHEQMRNAKYVFTSVFENIFEAWKQRAG
jgi:aspartate carbamoyltransferase catalytic subunit